MHRSIGSGDIRRAEFFQMPPVARQVERLDRCHAGRYRGLGHGNALFDEYARIERLGNDVLAAEFGFVTP